MKTKNTRPLFQVFCKRCGGLKVLKVGIRHSVVKPENWMKYGMASDIGCVCGLRREPKI